MLYSHCTQKPHIIWPATAVVVGDILHQFSYSYTKFCSYLEHRAEWKIMRTAYILQLTPIRDFLHPNCEMWSYTQLPSLKVPTSYFKIIQHNKRKAINLKILYFWKYQSSRSGRLILLLILLYRELAISLLLFSIPLLLFFFILKCLKSHPGHAG